MPNGRIVVTRSHAAAWTAATEWVRPLSGRSEVVVVAATRSAAAEWARSLPGSGAFGLHRFTLNQLAAAFGSARLAERGLAPVTRLGQEAICARIADQLRRKRRLPYFGPVARMPGFPRALASTLTELRLAGVAAAELPAAGGPARQDIARLLDAYEKEMARRALGDRATLLREAAMPGPNDLSGLPVLFLGLAVESPLEQAFLARVTAEAAAVFVTVSAGDGRSRAAFEQMLGVTAEAEEEAGGTALSRLREQMFSTGRAPDAAADNSLELFAAPGEGLEAVEIARRIQKDAALGVPFDETAILLRAPERYQPFLEEALRRAGVPAYFSRGAARPDPGGRAFLALLECAAEGCSASRFAEYLSLGEVPPLDPTGAPVEAPDPEVPADDELLAAFNGVAAVSTAASEDELPAAAVATPMAWERMIVDAAVVGGKDRWQRRLRGLENELRLKLAAEQPESETRREHLADDLQRLQALENFALPIVGLLSELSQPRTWGDWLGPLNRLARLSLRHPHTVLAVLAELDPMSAIGPVDIHEVVGVLSPRLRFLVTEPAGRRYGRVFVGSIDEARGRVFRQVFLPGLAEGLFPARTVEDPLLLDSARREVHPALPCRGDRREQERLLLRIAAASAAERLTVSYPSMDLGQGRSRVPSFYALEIARATTGRVPSVRAFEMAARSRSVVKLAWPAPAEPGDAIDEIEWDLAWVERHRGVEGSAAYLRNVNSHLIRALRARYARWRKSWCSADGVVLDGDAAARDVLGAHRLRARAYSASALQDYAACPYRFYLRAIAGLREREERSGLERMDPLTRGALFHAAQFRFFQTVQERAPQSLDDVLDAAGQAVDAVEGQYREELAPAIARVWETEIEDLRSDVRGWARGWWMEGGEWLPLYTELAFGLPDLAGRDRASTTEEVRILDGIRVRGAIDLVERHRAGGRLRITDHKTGKAPAQPPVSVGGGQVLQPALYALAAEALTGIGVDQGRLSFCTQRGGHRVFEIAMNDATRARLGRVLAGIDAAVASGFLPPAPAHGACGICDYRALCGPYEEVRSRRKDSGRLEPLNDVRCQP